MQIKNLTLTNYRNIESESIDFSEGINILHGENGQGKTNIMEAAYLFARGRSFRTAHDRELVKFGSDAARIELSYTCSGERTSSGILAAGISKIEGKRFFAGAGGAARRASPSEIIGRFRAVLFCPEHLSIVREGPAMRRAFLDVAISQLRPLYIAELKRFNAAVTQRNALLKQLQLRGGDLVRATPEEIVMLSLFSQQMAPPAAAICRMRHEYVERLSRHAEAVFYEMTGGKEIPAFAYEGSFGTAGKVDYSDEKAICDLFFEKYDNVTDREVKIGTTVFGPHHDDIMIHLNGAMARLFASQGQQRSLALSMKMAEGEISKEETGEYPVFLLDDVLSELDPGRREFVLERSAGGGKQVVITACDLSICERLTSANVIGVAEGKIL